MKKQIACTFLLLNILAYANLGCTQIEHTKYVQTKKQPFAKGFVFKDTVVLEDGLASLKIGAPVEQFWEVFKGLNI